MVDVLSSFVVCWRFFAPSSLDEAVVHKLMGREHRANVAISFVLVLLGLFVIGSASKNLAKGNVNDDADYSDQENILLLAFLSALVFGTLTALKFRYSKALASDSLYKDGICSLIGAVLSAALFISILLDPRAWWFDPIVACVSGFGGLYVGVMALYHEVSVVHTPIFSFSWWQTIEAPPAITAEPSNGTEMGFATTSEGEEKPNIV